MGLTPNGRLEKQTWRRSLRRSASGHERKSPSLRSTNSAPPLPPNKEQKRDGDRNRYPGLVELDQHADCQDGHDRQKRTQVGSFSPDLVKSLPEKHRILPRTLIQFVAL